MLVCLGCGLCHFRLQLHKKHKEIITLDVWRVDSYDHGKSLICKVFKSGGGLKGRCPLFHVYQEAVENIPLCFLDIPYTENT